MWVAAPTKYFAPTHHIEMQNFILSVTTITIMYSRSQKCTANLHKHTQDTHEKCSQTWHIGYNGVLPSLLCVLESDCWMCNYQTQQHSLSPNAEMSYITQHDLRSATIVLCCIQFYDVRPHQEHCCQILSNMELVLIC